MTASLEVLVTAPGPTDPGYDDLVDLVAELLLELLDPADVDVEQLEVTRRSNPEEGDHVKPKLIEHDDDFLRPATRRHHDFAAWLPEIDLDGWNVLRWSVSRETDDAVVIQPVCSVCRFYGPEATFRLDVLEEAEAQLFKQIVRQSLRRHVCRDLDAQLAAAVEKNKLA